MLRALAHQHFDDIFSRLIAEQLPQGFLVVGNAMALDQSDKVPLGVAAERRFTEMRISRDEILGAGIHIGEIAAPAARDQDLFARLLGVIQHQHRPTPGRRCCCAMQAGGAGTNHYYIVLAHFFCIASNTCPARLTPKVPSSSTKRSVTQPL